MIARPKIKKNRPKTVTKLVKELDSAFSRYVRLSRSTDGSVACFTCGHWAPVTKMHAGHYVSRFYKKTRWDERNVRPQCPMCNLWRRGDPATFREKLIQELGESVVKELEESRHGLNKLNRVWIEEKLVEYKAKIAPYE